MFHSYFTATSKTSLASRDSRINSSDIKSSDEGELLSMQDIHISHGHKTLLKIDKLTVPSQKLVAFIVTKWRGVKARCCIRFWVSTREPRLKRMVTL